MKTYLVDSFCLLVILLFGSSCITPIRPNTGQVTGTPTVSSGTIPTTPQAQTTPSNVATAGGLANGVRHRDLTISLGGTFTSTAQVTFPATGEGPWPTIILFAGSGPYDLNASYSAAPGEPVIQNFRFIAEKLSAAGMAVLRANKRGVLGDGQYDMAQVQQANMNQLIADAEAILAAAQAQPEIDTQRIYLYGWSEGAQVVANVAVNHPELAGLILHAAPNGGLEETLRDQQMEVALPYLRSTVDQNGDGQLSREELATIPAGPTWYTTLFYIWAPDASPNNPAFQSGLDANGNEAIDIDQELLPVMEEQLPTIAQSYAAVAPTATTAELVTQLTMPILILHGGQDGWVSSSNAPTIAAAAPDTATLLVYPNLGHALSPTEDPATDAFGEMASRPIEDMVQWITEIAVPTTE